MVIRRRKAIPLRSTRKQSSKLPKLFHALSQMPERDRCEIIRNSNDKFIHDLSNKVKSLKYKTRLPQNILTGIKKNKAKFRLITSPKINIHTKRRALTQKGGFLSLLLGSLVAPIAQTLFGGSRRSRGRYGRKLKQYR